ncbi:MULTISPECIES: response regulator [Cysteiniphilum]|uniref:response regulator n=1 Tax=Cysteiniphilum TaxID=2056696 RepID=UPI001786DAB0|nr:MULTISPECIES: response regulator [Cysteiniphilum]
MNEIAIIDDSKLVLTALSKILKNHGFYVRSYNSLQELYQAKVLAHIDAVIVDYWLENNSGIELIHYLNKLEPPKKNIKQVILSGSDLSQVNIPESVDLIIQKPWGDENFIENLKQLLRKETK